MGEMTTLEFDGPFDVYVSRPTDGTPVIGGLIVIEEIWGLQDHITDIADRFASLGYVVYSPDLMGRTGVHPALGAELQEARVSPDEKVRAAAQPRLREAFSGIQAPGFKQWAVGALKKTVDALEAEPAVDARIGVVGFCFGGSYAFAIAAADDRIKIAVPFYGSAPDSDEIADIHCPVLAFYGSQDERLVDGLPELTDSMNAAGVDFTSKVYEGTGHAFFNDTNVHTYDAEAATDSWRLTTLALSSALG